MIRRYGTPYEQRMRISRLVPFRWNARAPSVVGRVRVQTRCAYMSCTVALPVSFQFPILNLQQLQTSSSTFRQTNWNGRTKTTVWVFIYYKFMKIYVLYIYGNLIIIRLYINWGLFLNRDSITGWASRKGSFTATHEILAAIWTCFWSRGCYPLRRHHALEVSYDFFFNIHIVQCFRFRTEASPVISSNQNTHLHGFYLHTFSFSLNFRLLPVTRSARPVLVVEKLRKKMSKTNSHRQCAFVFHPLHVSATAETAKHRSISACLFTFFIKYFKIFKTAFFTVNGPVLGQGNPRYIGEIKIRKKLIF